MDVNLKFLRLNQIFQLDGSKVNRSGVDRVYSGIKNQYSLCGFYSKNIASTVLYNLSLSLKSGIWFLPVTNKTFL